MPNPFSSLLRKHRLKLMYSSLGLVLFVAHHYFNNKINNSFEFSNPQKDSGSFTKSTGPQDTKPNHLALYAQKTLNTPSTLSQFLKDGWQPINEDPPDEELINLNAYLFRNQEELLSDYILSNSFGDAQADQLASVFLNATQEKTKYAAIEALGRSFSSASQQKLLDLYYQTDSQKFKEQILPLIRPDHEGDAAYKMLISVAHDSSESQSRRDQAIFSLLIYHLNAGFEGYNNLAAPDRLIAQFDPNIKPRVQQLLDVLTSKRGTHSH